MNKITPTSKYAFTFSKDEKGQDFLFRFMLTLSKKLNHSFNGVKEDTVGIRLMTALASLDGIDNVDIRVGQYTTEVIIARTFDANVVIEEIKRILDEDVLSEIVMATPKQVAKLKLVTD